MPVKAGFLGRLLTPVKADVFAGFFFFFGTLRFFGLISSGPNMVRRVMLAIDVASHLFLCRHVPVHPEHSVRVLASVMLEADMLVEGDS